MVQAYLGAQSGVYKFDGEKLTELGLQEYTISAVYAFKTNAAQKQATLLAGSYGDGLFRSADGGATWAAANEGLTAPAMRTFLADPAQEGAILCGTEPGRGFRSADGGESWRELTGIGELPGSADWYLPYSPRAGALRNFYAPPGRPEHLFASIEVGGLLSSRDGGETWKMHETFDDDIHYITGHPGEADVLWMALGWAALKERKIDRAKLGGLARSEDGGQTWEKVIERDYTRAVIVPPTHPDLVLAGPAKKVGQQGRIEVSADNGRTWEPAGEGLESPMEDMVEEFLAAPDGSIWALCAQGRLMRAEPGAWNWQPVVAPPAAGGCCVESVHFIQAQ